VEPRGRPRLASRDHGGQPATCTRPSRWALPSHAPCFPPRIGNWQAQWLSQEGIRIESLESSHGVVRGTLSWRGMAPVSAWSATFSVPLEEGVL
jgi:hypothetical protein